MEERQVYVSFENPDYKNNKAELLRCKANLVNLQKALHNLHAIRSNKKRLIAHLHSLISASDGAVERLKGKMPDPTMPKGMGLSQKHVAKKEHAAKVAKIKVEKAENDFVIDNLDKELLELNRKIKELGG
jgi:hypothetical protein